MNHWIAGLCVASSAAVAHAQAPSLETPHVLPGDSWDYQVTTETGNTNFSRSEEELTVSRVSATSIYFSVKQVGSTQPVRDAYANSDWGRLRNVNGKEILVQHPLSFPLTVGKTWTLDYTEQHPNQRHSFEHLEYKFVVVGYEDVEVPGGKFKALKIESEGRWNAELAPNNQVVQGAVTRPDGTTMVTQANHTAAVPFSGRTYVAVWYVPEVKRWVKSVNEDYGSNGLLSGRRIEQLSSYKLGADESPSR